MDITAMATVTKGSKYTCYLIPLLFIFPLAAAEWTVTPGLGLTETYSDNVESKQFDPEDSYVTSAEFSLQSSVASKHFNWEMAGTYSELSYTHDHDLDKGYTTLDSNGSLSLFNNGPYLIFGARIDNVPRNSSENGFADLISGDTVQTEYYNAGLGYNIDNSSVEWASTINFYDSSSDDGIGESHGYTSSLSFKNGSGVRTTFWDINGSYNDRKNNRDSGRDFRIEATVGLITPIKVNPFVRYYDEQLSGNIGGNGLDTGSSLGAGIRWQPQSKLILDLSYNYAQDKALSDDYVAATVDWQPTSRTSIFAKYDQRFFGDSYQFKLTHKNKRLTNTLSYDETIQAFQRDRLETMIQGSVFCPVDQPVDINNCLPSLNSSGNPDNYTSFDIFGQEPIEDDQFSLNKTLAWTSTLTLSRTTFNVNVSHREREDLENSDTDKYFNASVSANRRMSKQSDIDLSLRFNKSELDVNEPNSQTDYYRIAKLTYNRELANMLTANLSLHYLSRTSDRYNENYDESRISLGIKKEF